MIYLSVLGLLRIVLGLRCYSFQCADINFNNNECVKYDSKTDKFELQGCQPENYTCPHPSYASKDYPLVCEYWSDRNIWSSGSWEEYYLYSVSEKGDNCDPFGIINVCNTQKDLVCACEGQDCKCIEGLEYGENCFEDPTPCIPGYLCSNKICTKKYSVKPGERATDETACEGGGPLVKQKDYFTCRTPPVSAGSLPKECQTDQDCLSSDGSEYTPCKCGLTTEAKSFCELHFGDEPMVNWREAETNGDYEATMYWKFVSVNWVYLQGSTPECLGAVWKDYSEFAKGVPSTTFSNSEPLVSLGSLSLLLNL